MLLKQILWYIKHVFASIIFYFSQFVNPILENIRTVKKILKWFVGVGEGWSVVGRTALVLMKFVGHIASKVPGGIWNRDAGVDQG